MIEIVKIKDCSEEISGSIIQSYSDRCEREEKPSFGTLSVFLKDIYEKVLYDYSKTKLNQACTINLDNFHNMISYIKEKELSIQAYKNSKKTYRKIIIKFLSENDLTVDDILITDKELDEIMNILTDKGVNKKDANNISDMFKIEYLINMPSADELKKDDFDVRTYYLGADNE